MSEEPDENGIASIFAAVLDADEIAFAGVFAICRRLIAKGIFDEADTEYVVRKMRDFIAIDPNAVSSITNMQHRSLDKMADAFGRAHAEITADRPTHDAGPADAP